MNLLGWMEVDFLVEAKLEQEIDYEEADPDQANPKI